MATRATYQVNRTTFYCHWDGYPTGAAGRFADMVDALTRPATEERWRDGIEDRRGGFEYAFIRGVLDAEPTKDHDQHGDTEYRYTLTTDNGRATIRVESEDSDEWRTIAREDLADWLNHQRGALERQLRAHKGKGRGYDGDPAADALAAIPVIVRVEEKFSYGEGVHVTYSTLATAEKVAAHFAKYAATFQPDNPNKAGYERKAAAWNDAIAAAQFENAA